MARFRGRNPWRHHGPVTSSGCISFRLKSRPANAPYSNKPIRRRILLLHPADFTIAASQWMISWESNAEWDLLFGRLTGSLFWLTRLTLLPLRAGLCFGHLPLGNRCLEPLRPFRFLNSVPDTPGLCLGHIP